MTVCLMATNAPERIRQLREGIGLTPQELAERLGATPSCVFDLEQYEEEVTEIIELNELSFLCAVLHGSAEWILTGVEATPSESGPARPAQLHDALLQKLQQPGIVREELWEALGWDASSFVDDPAALWSYPFDFLKELSAALGHEWRTYLTPTRTSAGVDFAFIREAV